MTQMIDRNNVDESFYETFRYATMSSTNREIHKQSLYLIVHASFKCYCAHLTTMEDRDGQPIGQVFTSNYLASLTHYHEYYLESVFWFQVSFD